MVKAYPAIIHCDLKIKTPVRTNVSAGCGGHVRRASKNKKGKARLRLNRRTLHTAASRMSTQWFFIYWLSRQRRSCQEVEKKYILL